MDGKLKEYQRTETLGKSQLDLILQVYDGAIAAYSAAKEAYEQNEYDVGYDHMERARRFITHLYTTLDPEKGGEVAENLAKLYAFVITQTDVAESTKNLSVIESSIEVLTNLRDGWRQLKSQENASKQDTSENRVAESDAGGILVSG